MIDNINCDNISKELTGKTELEAALAKRVGTMAISETAYGGTITLKIGVQESYAKDFGDNKACQLLQILEDFVGMKKVMINNDCAPPDCDKISNNVKTKLEAASRSEVTLLGLAAGSAHLRPNAKAVWS